MTSQLCGEVLLMYQLTKYRSNTMEQWSTNDVLMWRRRKPAVCLTGNGNDVISHTAYLPQWQWYGDSDKCNSYVNIGRNWNVLYRSGNDTGYLQYQRVLQYRRTEGCEILVLHVVDEYS